MILANLSCLLIIWIVKGLKASNIRSVNQNEISLIYSFQNIKSSDAESEITQNSIKPSHAKENLPSPLSETSVHRYGKGAVSQPSCTHTPA